MPYYPQAPGFNPLPNSITDAQLSDMPDGTVKGREIGSGLGDPANIGRALSYRNILGRNGGFEVWQRGAGGSASFTVPPGGQYTADGWFCYHSGASGQAVVSQQPASASVVGSRSLALIQRPNGVASVAQVVLEFPFDSDEIAMMLGSYVTLSFTMWVGANWSPASGTVNVRVNSGTGAPAKQAGVGYTGTINAVLASVSPTATPQRYSFTSSAPIAANVAQACVAFNWTPVGTAGVDDSIRIDDVQLEIGSIATPFERRPFESELGACRRHYFKTFAYGTAPAQAAGINTGDFQFMTVQAGATAFWTWLAYPVPMRAAPTGTLYNPAQANNQVWNAIASNSCSTTAALANERGMQISATNGPGATAGNVCAIHATADAGI